MQEWVGQQLGNYRLIRLLGRGGFADVYLGEHIYLKTQAAVKVLQVRLTENDLNSFLAEARTIASLKHPHIVRVLDFGVDGSTPYLVMDYAPYGTLRQLHSGGIQLPVSTILPYVRQVATALQYAHNNKLIHRDVKPENMLVGSDREILLSDFGIAVIAQSTRYGSTQEVAGTVAYMAPEQIQGKPRAASDQYSLGVVIYEWLSGDRPFLGSFAEVASQHLFASPPPLQQKNPIITEYVEEVVMTALEKEPQRRFVSIQAFIDALEQAHKETIRRPPAAATILPYASSLPLSTLPANRKSEERQAHMIDTPPALASPSTSISRTFTPSRRTVIIGLAALATVGGGLFAFIHNQETPAAYSGSSTRPTATKISKPTSTPSPSPNSSPTLPVRVVRFVYRGHSDQVYSIAWSPDGTRIASGGRGDIIQVWNASTGNTLLSYAGHTQKVYSIAWSPDGTTIASGHYDGSVQIWDAATGTLLFTYRGHPSTYQGGLNWINAVAWSPDGTRIASASHDTTVQICDARNGNHLLTYNNHTAYVNTVAWSPDGTRLASGSGDRTVQIWNATSGNTMLTYRRHSSDIESVAWSSDSIHIASGSLDTTVQIWDTTNGNLVLRHQQSDWINAVAWSLNKANIASGSRDKTVQVWSATTGNILRLYTGHRDVVQAVAWSPDNIYVASASNDTTVQIWSAIQ